MTCLDELLACTMSHGAWCSSRGIERVGKPAVSLHSVFYETFDSKKPFKQSIEQ